MFKVECHRTSHSYATLLFNVWARTTILLLDAEILPGYRASLARLLVNLYICLAPYVFFAKCRYIWYYA